MLCFKGNKGYKVVPKKKKVKATTSTSTSTNQTSAPRTRNGTGTGTGTGTAAVTQPTNRVAAKSTRPSPDRPTNPSYSNSRPSPSRKQNPEQGPPIQPPRQQSKVARTNNMASQNGSFYGRVDSAITSGFGDDESATAVQNLTSKSQGSSSSNTAQSQAYDTTPAPSTQAPFRYQRPSFLDDFDFTAESRRDMVVAHGVTSALSPQQGYHPTPASILNFADFDLENTGTKISDIRHDTIPPHKRPRTSTAAAAPASYSSSASPYERQALRAAVEEDENFFWCTSDCGSGQIHDSGSDQPIVVCIKCSHRSCFRHGVNWHEDLSCEEYDRLQEDPDFRGHLELENERWSKAQAAQEEADRELARSIGSEGSRRKAPNCSQKENRRGEEHCHIESHNKTMWRMRMGYREEFRLFTYDV
ncbi:hypothetical protein Forpe1208_v005069 [Fusarium oxysporum f. sp. rapae]|uniref:IBR domain-containing protein n=1 Tax=Fusarium oxysporum f. sp. rapae TaxID=485398 RepID=A0A8J5U1G1_FUSOX|nr:hypothetical protein Forpe1208_v005069 [Fusarium oxysporum f. sp. rapae]